MILVPILQIKNFLKNGSRKVKELFQVPSQSVANKDSNPSLADFGAQLTPGPFTAGQMLT